MSIDEADGDRIVDLLFCEGDIMRGVESGLIRGSRGTLHEPLNEGLGFLLRALPALAIGGRTVTFDLVSREMDPLPVPIADPDEGSPAGHVIQCHLDEAGRNLVDTVSEMLGSADFGETLLVGFRMAADVAGAYRRGLEVGIVHAGSTGVDLVECAAIRGCTLA